MTSQEEKKSFPQPQSFGGRGKGGKGLGKRDPEEEKERKRHREAVDAEESEDSNVYTSSGEDERLSNERDEFDRRLKEEEAEKKKNWLKWLIKAKSHAYDKYVLEVAKKGGYVLQSHPYLEESKMTCKRCGTRALDPKHLESDDFFLAPSMFASKVLAYCSKRCRKEQEEDSDDDDEEGRWKVTVYSTGIGFRRL